MKRIELSAAVNLLSRANAINHLTNTTEFESSSRQRSSRRLPRAGGRHWFAVCSSELADVETQEQMCVKYVCIVFYIQEGRAVEK